MRIVLLGGTGFIGQHFTDYCKSVADIVVVSRRAPVDLDIRPGVRYMQGDCSSPSFLRQLIQPGDHIVYLAYNSVPKTSFEDPLLDIQENLPLAISLLGVLRDVPVKRLLYLSPGGTVYGPSEVELPITEIHPTNPISPYGITKLAVEKYCLMYARLFGLPLVIARPSNPYGSGQLPDRGQGFIATAIAKILRGEEVPIFGKYGTVRDYIHITDLCAAMKALLDRETTPGEIFNIGSGIGRTNLDVLEAIVQFLGGMISDVKVKSLPERRFDVPYNVLDSTKIEAEGWQCSTTLEKGLATTIKWIEERINQS